MRTRWPRPAVLLAPLLLTGLPDLAGAALPTLDPIDGEFAVNTFVADRQEHAQVAMDEGGDFVVVWQSAGEDGSGDGVYQRRFPADAAPAAATALHTFTTGDQERASIDAEADGDWSAAWDSQDQAGATSDGDLILRLASAGGTILAAPFVADATAAGNAIAIAVARGGDGSTVAVYSRAFFPMLRKFDAAGAAVTGEIALDSGLLSFGIAVGETGAFALVASASDGSGDGVLLHLFDADGVAIGDPIPANVDTTGAQNSRGVGIARDGTIVVIWDDSSAERIEARLFRSDGEPLSGDLVLASGVGDGGTSARLDVAPDGGFVVAWNDGEIRAREFHRTGAPASEVASVNTTLTGLQRNPDVAAGGERLVVTWESDGQDGDSFGVYGQLFARRSIFADGFESGEPDAWTDTLPATTE